ncbi:MAG: response regulator [Phormidesmis sp.]
MVKALVIEDDTEIRANLLELLELEGYSVIGADNGATGLLGAIEYKPDIILCDVMMPELDGHDVLAALRQEPATALTPFIFLTALADKDDIRKGMTLGADDYITKPFVCSEVISAINSRMKKQAALAEQRETEQAQIMILQQEVQKFRSSLSDKQAALISDVRSQFKDTLKKLNTVDSLLKSLPVGEQRDQSLLLIQNVCAAEVKLLSRIPNFEYLPEALDSDNVEADDTAHEQLPSYTDEELSLSAY